MSPPLLAMANISKSFGTHQALDRVSLDVAPGEGVVIVGPSGCGKTTLLRLVAGLDVPDDGEIWMYGRKVSAQHRNIAPPHQRGIGFVFQDLALWPHLTVGGNLDFVLESAKTPRASRRPSVKDVLSLVAFSTCQLGFLTSCQVVNSSASHSLELWSGSRACSSSTSRYRAWTRSCARRFATSSLGFGARCASRWCTSRMTWRTRPHLRIV